MNQFFFIGNLTKDPELTETSSGVKVCRFSLAVNRDYVDGEGHRKTDFFNCVAWRGLAENVAQHVKKGNKVAVTGSIETRDYEDSKGVKRTAHDYVAKKVEFLTAKTTKEDDAASTGLQPFDDDSDIPF